MIVERGLCCELGTADTPQVFHEFSREADTGEARLVLSSVSSAGKQVQEKLAGTETLNLIFSDDQLDQVMTEVTPSVESRDYLVVVPSMNCYLENFLEINKLNIHVYHPVYTIRKRMKFD